MARAATRTRHTDPRVIEIDTARVLARVQQHFAVIDIGSNSIRLVVYDDLSRAPFPRFNEKSFCALGAGLAETGKLAPDAMDLAVRPADDLVIVFTSGSRGAPKGVIHTHGGALGATRSGLGVRGLEAGDRLYIPAGTRHAAEVVGRHTVVSLDGTRW